MGNVGKYPQRGPRSAGRPRAVSVTASGNFRQSETAAERPLSTPPCRSIAWSRTPGFALIAAVRGPLTQPRESTVLGHLVFAPGTALPAPFRTSVNRARSTDLVECGPWYLLRLFQLTTRLGHQSLWRRR